MFVQFLRSQRLSFACLWFSFYAYCNFLVREISRTEAGMKTHQIKRISDIIILLSIPTSKWSIVNKDIREDKISFSHITQSTYYLNVQILSFCLPAYSFTMSHMWITDLWWKFLTHRMDSTRNRKNVLILWEFLPCKFVRGLGRVLKWFWDSLHH